MLYHLFTYLDSVMDVPGAGLFQYISFRAGMSLITSLVIGILFGKRIIEWLQLKQVGEIVRDLGLEGQMNKQGTPTMGGLIILAAILIPTLLFADLTNIYTQMMLLVTVWLGAIGFIDDYIKVFKKNKEGLAGRFKVIGQVGMGVILGAAMIWHPDIAIKELADEHHLALLIAPPKYCTDNAAMIAGLSYYYLRHGATSDWQLDATPRIGRIRQVPFAPAYKQS